MAGRNRRHATLLKKAQELSTLCDAEVALITIEKDGKLHEFSCQRGKKADVEQTLLRYVNHPKGGGRAFLNQERAIVLVDDDDNRHHQRIHELKEQHERLELEMLQRMGRNLEGLSKEAIIALELEQKDALINVLKKKEGLLVAHLLQAKESQRQAIMEKEEALMRMEEPRLLQLMPEERGDLGNYYEYPVRVHEDLDLTLRL